MHKFAVIIFGDWEIVDRVSTKSRTCCKFELYAIPLIPIYNLTFPQPPRARLADVLYAIHMLYLFVVTERCRTQRTSDKSVGRQAQLAH